MPVCRVCCTFARVTLITVLSMKVRKSTSSKVASPRRRRIGRSRTAISGTQSDEPTWTSSAGTGTIASRVRDTTRAIGPLPVVDMWDIRRTSRRCTQKAVVPLRRPHNRPVAYSRWAELLSRVLRRVYDRVSRQLTAEKSLQRFCNRAAISCSPGAGRHSLVVLALGVGAAAERHPCGGQPLAEAVQVDVRLGR